MPMPKMGPTLRVFSRVPPDDYREIAKRAEGRGWTLSAYIAWVLAKEVRPKVQQRVTEFPTPYLDEVADG